MIIRLGSRLPILIIILLATLPFVILPGCARLSGKHASDVLGAAFDANYKLYLQGDTATGIHAMQDTVNQLENAGDWLSLHGKAHGLMMAHARLFCLYEKAGDSGASKIHFMKCVYWSVIRAEASQRPTDEIAQCLDKFDYEKCRKWVEDWDAQRRSRP